MACCAFAAFLLLQLLAPFSVLRRYVFGAPETRNAAVAWRYGDAAPAPPAGSLGGRRWQVSATAGAVLAIEAAVLAALLAAASPVSPTAAAIDDWDAFAALHTSWCRTGTGEERP